jgi:hypothetical protein
MDPRRSPVWSNRLGNVSGSRAHLSRSPGGRRFQSQARSAAPHRNSSSWTSCARATALGCRLRACRLSTATRRPCGGSEEWGCLARNASRCVISSRNKEYASFEATGASNGRNSSSSLEMHDRGSLHEVGGFNVEVWRDGPGRVFVMIGRCHGRIM